MMGVYIRTILQDESGLKLPPALQSLRRIADSAELSDLDVAEALAIDESLMACTLRLVNSALFAPTVPVDTPHGAVERVGRAQIADLALAGMAFQALKRVHPDIVTMQSFWQHSIASALAAREIGLMRGDAQVETYFAAGLLHDVGSLLFYTHINERDLMTILRSRNAGIPLFQIERDLLHFDHAELGGALLSAWQLPPVFPAVVSCHHAPLGAGAYQLPASIIHVADIVANAMGFGSRGQHRVPPLAEEAWEMLELPLARLPELIERIDQKADAVLQSFWEK